MKLNLYEMGARMKSLITSIAGRRSYVLGVIFLCVILLLSINADRSNSFQYESIINIDKRYLERAIVLAAQAQGRTRPNPCVGCVIVDSNGNIVGEGWHRKSGEPHAEVLALKDSGYNAAGCVAYVSLEPCNHFGRTPPCTHALINHSVSAVVAGMVDPDHRVAGKGLKFLSSANLSVFVAGLGQQENMLVEAAACRELNAPFVHRVLHRPFSTVWCGMDEAVIELLEELNSHNSSVCDCADPTADTVFTLLKSALIDIDSIVLTRHQLNSISNSITNSMNLYSPDALFSYLFPPHVTIFVTVDNDWEHITVSGVSESMKESSLSYVFHHYNNNANNDCKSIDPIDEILANIQVLVTSSNNTTSNSNSGGILESSNQENFCRKWFIIPSWKHRKQHNNTSSIQTTTNEINIINPITYCHGKNTNNDNINSNNSSNSNSIEMLLSIVWQYSQSNSVMFIADNPTDIEIFNKYNALQRLLLSYTTTTTYDNSKENNRDNNQIKSSLFVPMVLYWTDSLQLLMSNTEFLAITNKIHDYISQMAKQYRRKYQIKYSQHNNSNSRLLTSYDWMEWCNNLLISTFKKEKHNSSNSINNNEITLGKLRTISIDNVRSNNKNSSTRRLGLYRVNLWRQKAL